MRYLAIFESYNKNIEKFEKIIYLLIDHFIEGNNLEVKYEIVEDERMSDDINKIDWLIEALHEWWTDFEDMPPGLKDINLDKWLINNDRRTKFEEILNMVLEKVEEDLNDKVMKIIDILFQKIE